MPVPESFYPHDGAFERVLDRITPVIRPAIEMPGSETARLHFWTGPNPGRNPGPAAVAASYAEYEPATTPEQPVAPEATPGLAAQAALLRGEIRADLSVDDLRRLRRRCALLAHPDRASHCERDRAEQFMAEINAAIDRAIRNQTARHKT